MLLYSRKLVKGTGQPRTNVKLENTISKLKWEFISLSFAIICCMAYKSFIDFAIKVSIYLWITYVSIDISDGSNASCCCQVDHVKSTKYLLLKYCFECKFHQWYQNHNFKSGVQSGPWPTLLVTTLTNCDFSSLYRSSY